MYTSSHKVSPVYIFLFFLLLLSIFLLGVISFRIGNQVKELAVRVDELEKKPVQTLIRETTPEAGPSGTPVAPLAAAQVTPSPVTPVPTKTSSPLPQPSPTTKIRQTTFLPVVISMSTNQNDWVDVVGSDFKVNLSVEYGTAAYVTWDANLMVESGSGEASARIFDVTNGVSVPGSEVTTDSGQSSVATSGKMSMLAGQNTYRVQIKSKTSTLATFTSGRVKFVY